MGESAGDLRMIFKPHTLPQTCRQSLDRVLGRLIFPFEYHILEPLVSESEWKKAQADRLKPE